MRKFLLGLALLAPFPALAQTTPQRGQSGFDTGPIVACIGLDGVTPARCLMPGQVIYDTTGMPVGTTANPLSVSSANRSAVNLTTTQVSVGTTATLIAAARTGRQRLVITQSAAGPCYYGPTNAVSATTGARLIAAGSSKVYLYAGALYGICPGGAVTTDVDEEY